MTWIFNSTGGNLLMAILFHGSLAVALTPLNPGGQDPVLPVLTWLVVLVVIGRYGASNLARRDRFRWPGEQAMQPGQRASGT
jgi:hypothetical protein